MQKTVLKSYKIQEFKLTNQLNGSTSLKLETKFGYSVKFAPNGVARAELTVDSHDKEHPESFGVKVVIIGFFEVDPTLAKEELHVETYNSLYPTARATVSAATAAMGIPPIIIPAIDIRNQEIYRVDFSNNG